MLLLLAATHGLADACAAGSADAARIRAAQNARLVEEHRTARARWTADTNNLEAAWQLGRACFELADQAPAKSETERYALEGIAACRPATWAASNSAPAHYYLALNLGQLARVKGLGALKLVREMESHLHVANRLDPGFNFAGPDRVLGLLYRDAPGWPLSVGSRSKSRYHLQRAVAAAPENPDNHLCLLEALIDWKEIAVVRKELETTGSAIRRARDRLTGERWAAAWLDWDERWAHIRARVGASPAPQDASSPGH